MNFLRKDRWRLSLPQRIGIIAVLIGLLATEIIFNASANLTKLNFQNNDLEKITKLENELAELMVNYDLKNYNSSNYAKHFEGLNDSIKPFNPNDLTKQGWEKIGFTPKQAEVIMKYKQILGGKFESKEQIKKCFVISEEVYAVLEPKILLPNKSKSDEKLVKSQLSKKINYSRFNPNNLSVKDWVKLGFSQRQAEAILKYKSILGGEFKSKAQIKKCFVISEEKYLEMEPFIELPDEKEKDTFQKIVEDKIVVQTEQPVKKVELSENLQANDLNLEGWMKLGFTQKQAQTILNFKKSVGGKFKDAKTFKKCYAVSDEKFNELEPYLIFN